MDEILKLAPLEERIYRHRCVEAWSIVVPWIGYSLSALLKQVEPTSKAKFVAFESYYDLEPDAAGAPALAGIRFPYVEGLRLDEAMHPLALLCVGMYGETLPPQDGAPVRLVVPWKYGFKSIKSIVKIKLVEQPAAHHLEHGQRRTSTASTPTSTRTVDHPRWSQAKERRLGEFFKPPHPDVQRLRRPGGQPVRGHGPARNTSKPCSEAAGPKSCCFPAVPRVPCSRDLRAGAPGHRADLTANPIEFITHFTGDWTIRLIVITLAVTPLRKLLRLPRSDPLPPHDRAVRVLLRLPALPHLDRGWTSFSTCTRSWKDVVKRPFITAGFTALRAA